MTDNIENRLGGLESDVRHLSDMIKEYHQDLRDHMIEEGAWSRKLIQQNDRMGGIMTGVAMAVSSLWAVGVAVYAWFRQ